MERQFGALARAQLLLAWDIELPKLQPPRNPASPGTSRDTPTAHPPKCPTSGRSDYGRKGKRPQFSLGKSLSQEIDFFENSLLWEGGPYMCLSGRPQGHGVIMSVGMFPVAAQSLVTLRRRREVVSKAVLNKGTEKKLDQCKERGWTIRRCSHQRT